MYSYGWRPSHHYRLSPCFDTRYSVELAFQFHRSEVNQHPVEEVMPVLVKSGQSASREKAVEKRNLAVHHPSPLPPDLWCDESEACSVIAIRPWSSPSGQSQVFEGGLEDDVAGAAIVYHDPFHQAVRYSERYDQSVVMLGENHFLLLGREAYFVCAHEQAFTLGCL
ncbi:hypothetical protein F2Q69_00053302 [Brassica cretica]|uniref:Uncharacterized protein n=1 Tax=Brassica cretica TaxID=69181 RepID=A0A8S9N195_BRACR|nr:hypothetical protein F2Q69_00053302 [Brassica cretica]